MSQKETRSYYTFLANSAKPKFSKRLSTLDKFILEQYGKGHFDHIERWTIEYDALENTVKREIGYDASGRVIYAAPTRKNYGFWSDTNIPLAAYTKFGAEKIDAETFQEDFRAGSDD